MSRIRYRCENCGNGFDQLGSKDICMEEYNGVADLFGTRTYKTCDACPICGSFEYEEYYLPEAVPADAKLIHRVFPIRKVHKIENAERRYVWL